MGRVCSRVGGGMCVWVSNGGGGGSGAQWQPQFQKTVGPTESRSDLAFWKIGHIEGGSTSWSILSPQHMHVPIVGVGHRATIV